FHSFEWRRAGPAALRCGSEKCTGSKGARLAHRPFPETRQLSRGNIRESRQPTDGSGARRSQVQPDRLLRKDTLDLELLLLFGRVPNARIRRRCSKGDKGRQPNAQGLDFQALRGENCSRESARGARVRAFPLLWFLQAPCERLPVLPQHANLRERIANSASATLWLVLICQRAPAIPQDGLRPGPKGGQPQSFAVNVSRLLLSFEPLIRNSKIVGNFCVAGVPVMNLSQQRDRFLEAIQAGVKSSCGFK